MCLEWDIQVISCILSEIKEKPERLSVVAVSAEGSVGEVDAQT